MCKYANMQMGLWRKGMCKCVNMQTWKWNCGEKECAKYEKCANVQMGAIRVVWAECERSMRGVSIFQPYSLNNVSEIGGAAVEELGITV